MELSQYLLAARRWWWLLLGSMLVAGAVAYGVSTLITPKYRAGTVLLVVQQQTPGVVQFNDIQASLQIANTFAQLIKLRPVMEQAIAEGKLGLTPEQLQRRITVSNPRATQLLRVSVVHEDPALARDVANIVAQTFVNAYRESDLTSRAGNVRIVEPAVAPSSPESPNMPLQTALGAVLGLLGATALVLLVEYLDDTVKSAEEVSELTGVGALGAIEEFGRSKRPTEQLVAANAPRSSAAEAYRTARTNLTYALEAVQAGSVVLVTSGGTREGKTTTVANMAVVFGLAGHKVVVVDCDLRRPSIHRVFGMQNGSGLTNTLLSGADIDAIRQQSSIPNVSVITSGPIPPNPSELLGSARMRDVIALAREQYDIVLVDSPPVLAVTDAVVLATICDSVVVVVRSRHTRNAALRAVVSRLAQAGRPIVGALINRVRRGDGYYGYAYRYYGRRVTEERATARVDAVDGLVVGADSAPSPSARSRSTANRGTHR